MEEQKASEITISFKNLENGKIIAIEDKSEHTSKQNGDTFYIKIISYTINIEILSQKEHLGAFNKSDETVSFFEFEVDPSQTLIDNIPSISATPFYNKNGVYINNTLTINNNSKTPKSFHVEDIKNDLIDLIKSL